MVRLSFAALLCLMTITASPTTAAAEDDTVVAGVTWKKGTGKGAKAGDCKGANDYQYNKCGTDEKNGICCSSQQVCLGPFKTNDAAGVPKKVDTYKCSKARKLTGTKAVKIIVMPLFFFLMDVGFLAYMILKCDAKLNPITKFCIGLIALSWPFYLTEHFVVGVWTSILAVVIAHISAQSDLPTWLYKLAWAIQVFQLIAMYGPYEGFHIPFFSQSSGETFKILTGKALAMTPKSCNKFYNNYFQLLDVEKKVIGANPDGTDYGLCTEEWLSTVVMFVVLQAILLTVMVLFTARDLLSREGASSSLPKVAALEA
jgi:hypothetical protein